MTLELETSPSTPPNTSSAKKGLETATELSKTIYDLPVEILLYIFTLNTQQTFYHVHNPSRTTRHTSQVCKQWREIALNCSALWAQSIDFKDPMVWLKKVTTRCGTLPIDMMIPSVTNSLMKSCADEYPENLHLTSPRPVDLVRRWDLPMSYDAKVLSPWFFHLPQCRSLTLKISAVVWDAFSLDKMDLSHLESLTVVEAGASIIEPLLLRLWKPETFVDETPWNLRSLTLSGCITTFDPHAFRHLSELTVHNPPNSISLSPIEWIDVLSNMPDLKQLELISATLTPAYHNLEEPEMFSYVKRHVSLPRLERLHLDAPLRHCSHIFDRLEFPPSCNITIAACGLSSIDTPLQFLLIAIERHFERHSSEKSISLNSRSLLAAVTPSSCVVNLTSPKHSQGSLSLSVRWNANPVPQTHLPFDPLEVFSSLISAIRKPCANVTDLNLVAAITLDNEKKHHAVLDTFLSSFDRLERIEQISFSTLQFLLPFFDLRTDLRRTKIFGGLLPCLRAISFVDVNFANYKIGEFSLLGMLLSFVRSRLFTSKSGLDAGSVGKTPITDVRFRFCRAVRERAVKQFEKIGVTVLRDGMTLGYVTIGGGKDSEET